MDRVPDFSSGVIFKLMSFTFAMITLPIGTYFFTNAYVFNGTFNQSNLPTLMFCTNGFR